MYSDNAQRTSKHDKNTSHATHLQLNNTLLCSYPAYFNVICVFRVNTHGQRESICLGDRRQ